jgi:hypothetical protein
VRLAHVLESGFDDHPYRWPADKALLATLDFHLADDGVQMRRPAKRQQRIDNGFLALRARWIDQECGNAHVLPHEITLRNCYG